MVCCPMTTQIKNYPFEVVIAGTIPSAVLADQVKSLDWRKRRAKRKGTIADAELAEVRANRLKTSYKSVHRTRSRVANASSSRNCGVKNWWT